MLMLNLSALALRSLIGSACELAGLASPGEGAFNGVVRFLERHFIDQSQRLTKALQQSNERAWKALEIALAGDSLWDRCKLAFARADDKAFREQIRPFLDACPLAELHGKDRFRQACLQELHAAGKAGLLHGTRLDAGELARRAGAFARFNDPQQLLAAETAMLGEMGDELRRAGYENLSSFVGMRPSQGQPLLVVTVRYFFRRAVEDDQALFQGLTFTQIEGLQAGVEAAFAGLNRALVEQGDRLAKLLDEVIDILVQTRDLVLDVRQEQQRQGEQAREIYQAVVELQNRLDLANREVRPRDSLSIRGDGERRLVKELVLRYRGLPEEQRQELPALLNAIGKLEIAAGDFSAAQKDFEAVAGLVVDPKAQAEAHANAYQAALERRDFDAALNELRQAARLDPARFAPFPMDKYEPKKILGAGGFGVAFLCRHRFLKADVVVKSLLNVDLDRGIDEVFGEAQVLRQVDHPSIIRVQDCGFGDPSADARPFLVMDYFDGTTLDALVREQPLTPPQALQVAKLMAVGLQAAHGQRILHRDVKPANVLVRRPTSGEAWQLKLIDFGLALRRGDRETMMARTTATVVGSSIAGTIDYAAPEQMGKLPGTVVGPAADVYGFGRTLCFALFGTPQPLPRHWRSVPESLSELLEGCLEERPEQRPTDFSEVLRRLEASTPAPAAPPVVAPLPAAPTMVAPPAARTIVEPAPAPSAVGDARQQGLKELIQQVTRCTKCPALCRSRTQTVFGVGPLDPPVLFIGEAPGAEEDRTGEPFMGSAGQLFNGLLQEVGLRREEVYIANLLKCRPPGNRPPQPDEATNCRDYLERQIDLIRPKVICAMGTWASQNLLRTSETIGRMRGQFRVHRGIPVMCTYHPAFLLSGRSPHKRGEVVGDLRLLMRRIGK